MAVPSNSVLQTSKCDSEARLYELGLGNFHAPGSSLEFETEVNSLITSVDENRQTRVLG